MTAQTYHNWELVVLDNSDERPFGLRVYDDERINYVWDLCDGVADASTKALNLATGDIIIPLGDDDTLAPTALERAVEAFTQWPTLQWMYGVTQIDGHPGGTIHRGHIPFSLSELRKWYYLGGAVYWRKSLTDRLGGYLTTYEGAADYDLYLKFAEDSVPYWCPEVLYFYTWHDDADGVKNAERQRAQTERIVKQAGDV